MNPLIAFITGSGFYDMPDFETFTVETPYGWVQLLKGAVAGRDALILPRHGSNHRYLPHQINHRANLSALNALGANAVISLSVCGVCNADHPLGRPFVASDLYFPENRLGDGSACTIFDQPEQPGRGHFLAAAPFNPDLVADLSLSLGNLGKPPLQGVYGHVIGPRFNSKSEIAVLRSASVDFISMTCGPEAVLANELEIPYALVGYGVDYANGVVDPPTAVEELKNNLGAGVEVFRELILHYSPPQEGYTFSNFVFRFG